MIDQVQCERKVNGYYQQAEPKKRTQQIMKNTKGDIKIGSFFSLFSIHQFTFSLCVNFCNAISFRILSESNSKWFTLIYDSSLASLLLSFFILLLFRRIFFLKQLSPLRLLTSWWLSKKAKRAELRLKRRRMPSEKKWNEQSAHLVRYIVDTVYSFVFIRIMCVCFFRWNKTWGWSDVEIQAGVRFAMLYWIFKSGRNNTEAQPMEQMLLNMASSKQ